MNFATTKERILEYLNFKGIKVSSFLVETEIKRGFLDSDKLKSSVSDIFLTKIIAKYPDLNLIWLLTGKGPMILQEDRINTVLDSENIRMLQEIQELSKEDQERILITIDTLIKGSRQRNSEK